MRRVEELLKYLDEDLSYRGDHYWVQKLGEQKIWTDKLPSTIVVDETVMEIGGDHWYLYAAIAPEDRMNSLCFNLSNKEPPNNKELL